MIIRPRLPRLPAIPACPPDRKTWSVPFSQGPPKTIEYFEAMLVKDGAPDSLSPDRTVNSRAISPSAAL
jgi:hypothetical protein